MVRLALVCAFCVLTAAPSYAADLERDFSGAWILVPERSNAGALGTEIESQLTVSQDDGSLRCSAVLPGGSAVWSYNLGGAETRYRVGPDSRNSVAKWEGAALLINTLVSGPQNYTLMDRWQLSRDRSELTITRQMVRAHGEADGTLVYARPDAPPARPEARANFPAAALPPEPAAARPPAPVLMPRTPPAAAPDTFHVTAGTRILLSLVNSLNTKKSRAGDRVYLRTAIPVAVHDRIVIPRDSDVAGTIVESPAAKGKKGELYIRFDSLTLPNGVTRDLLSRPDGSGEGKLASTADTAGDVRRTAEGAGIGASVGGIAGAAAGHAGLGLGIGGLAGAAAGLGGIFSKKPEPILHPGTTLEMVLDRDLAFQPSDLR